MQKKMIVIGDIEQEIVTKNVLIKMHWENCKWQCIFKTKKFATESVKLWCKLWCTVCSIIALKPRKNVYFKGPLKKVKMQLIPTIQMLTTWHMNNWWSLKKQMEKSARASKVTRLTKFPNQLGWRKAIVMRQVAQSALKTSRGIKRLKSLKIASMSIIVNV